MRLWPKPKDAPRTHRLSFARAGGVVLSLVVCGTGIVELVGRATDSFAEETQVTFAPYVDITLTPVTHFEDPLVNPTHEAMLGFVVADRDDPCLPSWGTYYTLDAASRGLDLDRRIARYAERGGEVGISFGGQANSELATVCTDDAALLDAYRMVYDRYTPSVLDFDIEGAALDDAAASTRRARALAQLQDDVGVEVWITIPVAGHGLLESGLAAVDVMLEEGVELSIINLMTMNFGGSRESSHSMGEGVVAALEAAHPQLVASYASAGETLATEEMWAKIGATVMIGQNDVASDRLEVSDAQHVAEFANQVGLGQLAMWSLNRDVACGDGTPAGSLSNTCSGVEQDVGQFASVLSASMSIPVSASPDESVGEDNDDIVVVVQDDARRSPYPIWRANRSYDQESKVVWQGRVYQAKWWSENDPPGASVDNVWDTPWRYLGPVVESDFEPVEHAGTGDEWELWRSETIYLAGDEIEFGGEVFRCLWWTQGALPEADPDQPYDHPWERIGSFEVADDKGNVTGLADAKRVYVADEATS